MVSTPFFKFIVVGFFRTPFNVMSPIFTLSKYFSVSNVSGLTAFVFFIFTLQDSSSEYGFGKFGETTHGVPIVMSMVHVPLVMVQPIAFLRPFIGGDGVGTGVGLGVGGTGERIRNASLLDAVTL